MKSEPKELGIYDVLYALNWIAEEIEETETERAFLEDLCSVLSEYAGGYVEHYREVVHAGTGELFPVACFLPNDQLPEGMGVYAGLDPEHEWFREDVTEQKAGEL